MNHVAFRFISMVKFMAAATFKAVVGMMVEVMVVIVSWAGVTILHSSFGVLLFFAQGRSCRQIPSQGSN